jgi:hypothetical protein
MPVKPAPEPDPTPAPITSAAPVAAEPGAGPVPDGRLPAGVYQFTGSIATQYLDVPVTARPADPGRPADGDDPGAPPTPATVFDWPFSAPADGRWEPTKKKPNQVADNAAPLTSEE